MHTPDGFITGWICIVMALLSSCVLVYALYVLRSSLNKDKILQMSFIGLLIFAGQMLNFPIASGTSGHLIGAALAAIMLGPYAAIVVISLVLIVQCFVFGDGGLLALGVNIFAMAIVASYTAHFVYRKLERTHIALLSASWASVFAASIALSVLLALSGLAPLTEIVLAMASTHAFIGIGEGLISLGIFAYLNRTRSPQISIVPFLSTLGILFIVLAFSLPFASGAPDGLEYVALRLGFYNNAMTVYQAPFADYLAFGSELAAGILGMLATFAVIVFLGYAAKQSTDIHPVQYL